MSAEVIVIGAGVAGLAAAWSAQRAGATVTLVGRGAGASALGGGAVDDVPWESRARDEGDAPPLEPELRAFSDALGLWHVADGAIARVATIAGRIRPARGRDRALLDLGAIEGGQVLVPRAPRAAWDADSIAAALRDQPFASARGLRFVAVDLPVLRHEDERRLADGDLAGRHDDEGRLAWLGVRLRDGVARAAKKEAVGGILLGPWLGAAAARAEQVSGVAGVPVGEALVGVGSAAGLRFEAARDRLLVALGVEVVRALATRIERRADRIRVALEEITLTARAVVIATGGMVGGGVLYAPPERRASVEVVRRAAPSFALSLDAPVRLAVGGAPLDVVSSLNGPELDTTAWPDGDAPGVLESVGILCDGTRAGSGLQAAGDVVADRPRTLLEAVASGIRAGREAARQAGGVTALRPSAP